MIGLTLLFIFVFCIVVIFGIYLEFETSEIIASEAIVVAIFGAIFNFVYTQKAYMAANFPIPLISPRPPQKRDIIEFSVVNPHKSVLIKEIKLLVEMKYSRLNPNWWRYTRWKKICEGSTKLILPELSSIAGKTANLAQIVEHHYPHVLQSYINNDGRIEVTGEFVFDLKFRIEYIPLISGGKREEVKYFGTLIPEKTGKNNLHRWKVDVSAEYPQPPGATSIG